ncbi:MAG: transposase [Acidovorax sp.]
MHTNESQSLGGRRRRRAHSDEFKADAIAAAARPNVSMASLALSLGINANLLRCWVREAEVSSGQLVCGPAAQPESGAEPVVKPPAFVPVQLPIAVEPAGEIHLEIRRGAMTVAVTWPVGLAAECGAWLREVLR